MKFRAGRLAAVKLSAAAMLAIAAVATIGSPASAAVPVKFTKIQYNSPGADKGSNKSLNAEWVRITNKGGKARYLSGWTLRDAQSHVYKFPTFRLKAGASVWVHTGKGSNTASNLYWGSSWYIWNNTGDKATLKNRSGDVIDTCKWGDGSGVTYC